ncbi:site-specific integrase [Nocardia sp. NBC_01499]|uniref:tyrosine-type recombinase/integrase n=1 Tax=Nocardia sp. NBC_01499 TaxID=2903597 RepID=UPI0038670304
MTAAWGNCLTVDKPKTVRNIHVMLHRALADAKSWKYIVDNPASAATPPRVTRKKRPVWNPQQASQFMAHARHDRFYALFRLELTTGQRRGEICGVRWPSIDLDQGRQSIHESRVVVDGYAQDGQVKTDDSARQNSLDPETVQALSDWKTIQDAEREFFDIDYTDTDLVFTWEDGRPVHPDSIRERFKRLAAEAGLPEIRFYDLRHTYVTGALAAGISPKVVSERVGHADVAFTLKTYSHVLPGMDQDAAVRGADYLLGGTGPHPIADPES